MIPAHVISTLKARRYKITRQRRAVLEALAQAQGHLSPQEVHERVCNNEPSVGLATVYRTLQQLCADGEVDVLRTADGESVYRRCSPRHHHHLICRACRHSIEIANNSIERWAEQIAAENGFAHVEHVVEVFGTCSTCTAQEAQT